MILEKRINLKEDNYLRNAFKFISKGKDYFDAKDLLKTLIWYNLVKPKIKTDRGNVQEMKLAIQNMIWEIDESGTGKITEKDLKLMYHKCRFDETGLEPKSLYYIVLFIMYSLTTTSDK